MVTSGRRGVRKKSELKATRGFQLKALADGGVYVWPVSP